MAFDGSEGGPIQLNKAKGYTATYRAQNPNGLKGHFFGREILNDILEQTGCEGIRIYYGINDDGEQALVLVGADANEDDMLGETHTIGDYSIACPNRCGSSNALNS